MEKDKNTPSVNVRQLLDARYIELNNKIKTLERRVHELEYDVRAVDKFNRSITQFTQILQKTVLQLTTRVNTNEDNIRRSVKR